MLNRAYLPLITLLFALAAQAAAAQSAAEQSPYYVSLGAGLTRLPNVDNTYVAPGTGLPAILGFQAGWVVSGAYGRRFYDHIRAEFEINHRGNDVRSATITTAGIAASSPGGEEDSTGFMANAFYDISTGYAVTPYVGAGLGVGILSQTVGYQNAFVSRSNSTAVAYQVIAGVSIPFGRGIFGTLDYRYFGTGTPSFTDKNSQAYTSEYGVHSIVAGIRFPM